MNISKRWLAAAGAVAAVAALAWAFAPRPVAVEVAEATRGAFETSIEEDAKTRVRDRYVLSAPLAGRLARIGLREGDEVQAGDSVAQLTPVLPTLVDERTLRGQVLAVEAAQANVRRATARLEAARASLQQARSDALRSDKLADQGYIAAGKRDADRVAAQVAEREFEAATQERVMAQHEAEQAQAALAAVRPGGAGGAGFPVRAPVAGRVLRVLQGSEATVALGTPLIELGDVGHLEVVAELLTADALQALPGRPVVVERWGGEGTLAAQVRRVEPAAFTKVSALGVEEQRVKVIIDLDGDPQRWRALGDGYRVGVRIVTRTAADALKVPVSAVFPDGAGHAVFLLQDGRARKTPVEVVARNANEAWIAKGLGAGAQVIVYPPAAVADGVRVKPRKV
ncbi:MAG: efflux RND transporter periplasmic adaptor subunit [Burkholderiaceae bacterium]